MIDDILYNMYVYIYSVYSIISKNKLRWHPQQQEYTLQCHVHRLSQYQIWTGLKASQSHVESVEAEAIAKPTLSFQSLAPSSLRVFGCSELFFLYTR